MTSLIKNHFKRVKSYPRWRFILELTILCFISKVISASILTPILYHFGLKFYSADLDFNKSLLKTNMLWSILSVVFFAALETLWGQMFLLWLSSKFTKKTWLRVAFATIIFSLAHVDIFQIIAIWPIGLILTWVYFEKRQKSRWEAFWVTTTIHSLHNYLALFLLWLSIR